MRHTGITTLAALSLVFTSVANAPSSNAGAAKVRPYSITDYLRSEDISDVNISPNGRYVAVGVKRALRVQRSFEAQGYTAFDQNSEIRVFSTDHGKLVWISRGRGGVSDFAPEWSDDGTSLAFLSRETGGHTSLRVWRVDGGASAPAAERDVDTTVLFAATAPSLDREHHFIWSADGHLVVARRGSLPSDPLGASRSAGLERLWLATREGQTSVRVWDSRTPALCNAGVTVYDIDPFRKRPRQVYRGNVLAVSVARRSSAVAITKANGFDTIPKTTLHFPEAQRFGNANDLNTWSVAVVDRRTGRLSQDLVSNAGPVANMAIARLSEDGSRLAVPLGNSVTSSGSDAVAFVNLVQNTKAETATDSLADAASLATIYVSSDRPAATPLEKKQRRSAIGTLVRPSQRIEPTAQGWTVATDKGVQIFDKLGKQTWSLDGGALSAVQHWQGVDSVLVRAGNTVSIVSAAGKPLRTVNLTGENMNVQVSGVTDKGDVIAIRRSGAGIFLSKFGADGWSDILTLNSFFRSVASPSFREIDYLVNGQRRAGLLLLPTSNTVKRAVIMTAYPTTFPVWEYRGLYTDPSSALAWRWHPLLAHGFAVFVADFRREANGPNSDPEPSKLIADELFPAIDAIRAQRDVDGTKLGFAGYSYGGYTALILATFEGVFKAVSAEVPLADLNSNYAPAPEVQLQKCAPAFGINGLEELEAPEGFIRLGAPSDREYERKLRANNPLDLATTIKIPTQIITGEFDMFNAGAERLFMRLYRQGTPSRLVTYRAENHNIESSGNVVDMISKQVGWFDEYLGKNASIGVVAPSSH